MTLIVVISINNNKVKTINLWKKLCYLANISKCTNLQNYVIWPIFQKVQILRLFIEWSQWLRNTMLSKTYRNEDIKDDVTGYTFGDGDYFTGTV